MEREGEETGPSRRTWAVFFGVAWALMGAWSLAADRTWLGLAQLAFAGVHALAAVSPRVAAFWDTPLLFRRK